MIKVTELSCQRNGRRILDRINLDIAPNSFVAVMGHNGSGKTTLVRHLNALITPQSGCVSVDGMDTADKKNLCRIRKRTGMVFQNPESQSVASTVEDDIAFGPENLGLDADEIQHRIDTALSVCGAEHLRNRDISTLSSGEKQLIAIAGIIAMQPEYAIFDEATSMLDNASAMRVLECAARLRNELKMTVIWVTHNVEEASLADRVIVLDNGKITADGRPSEVFPDIGHTERKTNIPRTTAEKSVITLEHISYSYPTPTGSHNVLKDISLDIPKGRITAITGRTGCGKSTLAEILGGITKPDSGSVSHRGSVGIAFQTPIFFEDTVYDEIAYMQKRCGINDDKIKQIMCMLGLSDELLSVSPFALSGGEKRLVALGAVIAASPDVLILDEPTAGLDPVRKNRVSDILQSLKKQGKTVVCITGNIELTEISDKLIVLNGGDGYAS